MRISDFEALLLASRMTPDNFAREIRTAYSVSKISASIGTAIAAVAAWQITELWVLVFVSGVLLIVASAEIRRDATIVRLMRFIAINMRQPEDRQ
jgi:hypothetical protein